VLPATIKPKGEGFAIASGFIVKPEDYDINIPGTVRDNIAKEILVKVSADLARLK
jgi:hypothetical protein